MLWKIKNLDENNMKFCTIIILILSLIKAFKFEWKPERDKKNFGSGFRCYIDLG